MKSRTDLNECRRLPSIKILDTDKLFKDSPNEGEPGCDCSRCHKQIKVNETPFRVAVDKEILYSKDKNGKEHPFVTDIANGLEFRLCNSCLEKVKQEIASKK